ncbi:hypothetical protein [Bosea sp. Tri-44]|uniref:hypothetical protein n=1 Tax=Bosea sp. Tri-44 TaxID=1972137 RepID=UPI00100FC637|nr:hypothetical protein [Bosea sp. Tri-44]
MSVKSVFLALFFVFLYYEHAHAEACSLLNRSEQDVNSVDKKISVLHNSSRSELFFVSHMNWNNDGSPLTYHPDEWKRVNSCNDGANPSEIPRSANTLCNGITIRREGQQILRGYMTTAEAKTLGLSPSQRKQEAIKRCNELLCYVKRASLKNWNPEDFSVNWSAIATYNPDRPEDGRALPCIQNDGPYKGYFVSATSFSDGRIVNVCNYRRYVDPFSVPAVVRPGNSTFSPIKLPNHLKTVAMEGGVAAVVDLASDRVVYAIIGDSGPGTEAGEVSPFLHWEMKGTPKGERNPWEQGKRMAGPFAYVFLPHTKLRAVPAVSEIEAAGAAAFDKWGGIKMARACASAAKR